MTYSLVLQSYGNMKEYRRGLFAVFSFFAHIKGALDQVRVLIFTDNPDFFRLYLADLPVGYYFLDAATIKHWRGEIDFLHRIKIAVIEKAFLSENSDLLYIDSDTCFVKDPSPMMHQLDDDHVFMHTYEYRYKEMASFPLPAGAPAHRFYDFVDGRFFTLTDGTRFQISPDQVSWNAGVIALKYKHNRCLPDVYHLTDQLFPASEHHGCEQFAFGIILEKIAKVDSAEEYVFHYWQAVQKNVADTFLYQRITEQWAKRPLSQKMKDISAWSTQLSVFIENHVLMLRYLAIIAFHENRYAMGWRYASRALAKEPFFGSFWLDVLYHLKRNLIYLFRAR